MNHTDHLWARSNHKEMKLLMALTYYNVQCDHKSPSHKITIVFPVYGRSGQAGSTEQKKWTLYHAAPKMQLCFVANPASLIEWFVISLLLSWLIMVYVLIYLLSKSSSMPTLILSKRFLIYHPFEAEGFCWGGLKFDILSNWKCNSEFLVLYSNLKVQVLIILTTYECDRKVAGIVQGSAISWASLD